MSDIFAGIRVIDHGTMITGPFAAMLLGDLGAEVIKIERPIEGDPYRSFQGGLYAPHFQANNRNKQSVAVDLNEPSEREFLLELIDTADVYVQNFRPGVAEKLGLGAEALRARNPRLVYCAISGFGQSGPYAKRPAYDTVAQGLSGFLSMFVDKNNPRVVGPAVADTITGLYAAYGILGALVEQKVSGKGRLVEVAMIEAMMHFASEPYANFFASGKPWKPHDRARVSQSYVVECADGSLLSLHLSSPPKFWQGLLEVIERPDLEADPRFATRMDRIKNQDALIEIFRPIFITRPRDEWTSKLQAADVPHAPVLNLDEALDDPQVRHLGIESRVEHPTQGTIRGIRRPITYDGKRGGNTRPPPTLNEHGPEIRAALKSKSDRPAK